MVDPQSISLLAAKLRTARLAMLHGAGCACCGRGPVRLEQEMMEAALLGFLSTHYAVAGETRLAALVDAWLQQPERGLLSRLGDECENNSDRATVLRDVLEILDRNADGRALA